MFKLCIKFIYFGKTSKFPKKKHNLHKVFLKKNFINQRNLPPKKSIDWNLVRSKNSFFFSPNNILLKIRPIFSWHVDSVGSWFFPPGGWMKNHGHLWMNLLALYVDKENALNHTIIVINFLWGLQSKEWSIHGWGTFNTINPPFIFSYITFETWGAYWEEILQSWGHQVRVGFFRVKAWGWGHCWNKGVWGEARTKRKPDFDM